MGRKVQAELGGSVIDLFLVVPLQKGSIFSCPPPLSPRVEPRSHLGLVQVPTIYRSSPPCWVKGSGVPCGTRGLGMGPSQAKQQSSDHIASILPSAVAFLENTKALNVMDQISITLVDARALGLWIQVLCEGRMDSSSSQQQVGFQKIFLLKDWSR